MDIAAFMPITQPLPSQPLCQSPQPLYAIVAYMPIAATIVIAAFMPISAAIAIAPIKYGITAAIAIVAFKQRLAVM